MFTARPFCHQLHASGANRSGGRGSSLRLHPRMTDKPCLDSLQLPTLPLLQSSASTGQLSTSALANAARWKVAAPGRGPAAGPGSAPGSAPAAAPAPAQLPPAPCAAAAPLPDPAPSHTAPHQLLLNTLVASDYFASTAGVSVNAWLPSTQQEAASSCRKAPRQLQPACYMHAPQLRNSTTAARCKRRDA